MVGLCPFRQRGIWTLDSVDFATAWTFSVEMSGSGCSASGEPTPTTTPSSCSFTSPGFRGNSSNRNHSEPRERSKPYTTTTSTRRTVLAVACSLLADPGRRPCAIFLMSHSSATRHQWLNLFSTRHECFTSDVGLTRTRLVSCILLTSLLSFYTLLLMKLLGETCLSFFLCLSSLSHYHSLLQIAH